MFESRNGKIFLGKEPDELDKFVVHFVELLEAVRIKYVIVSGYPTILFGRSRMTEDVDFLTEKVQIEKLKELVEMCHQKGFWIINPGSPDDLMLLMNESNVRIAREGEGIPNIELKFAKDDFDFYALENALTVVIGEKEMRISPVELQIAYKLYLGSEKDIEDAKYLYSVCGKIIEKEKLEKFMDMLKIKNSLRRIFGDNYGH